MLLLEDLHRADAETLALVDYLAGVVRSTGVLVAFSARVEPPALKAITRLTTGRVGHRGPAVPAHAGADRIAGSGLPRW